MKRSLTSCVVGAIALIVLAATTASASLDDGAIRLRSRAQVSGERIVLGEIARLTGNAIEFDEVDLGHAPDAGSTRRITGASILARLRDAGLDEASVRYHIPVSVLVERAHQEIDPEDVRGTIEEYMRDWLPPGDEVDSVALPTRMRIPLGEYALRVNDLKAVSRRLHEIEVEAVQDGRVVSRAPVRLRISSRSPVVVARRAIPRGETITEDDLRTEERNMRGLHPTVITDASEAIGRLARVAIGPGSVLSARAIESPVLVERGDRVRVAIETAAMRLTVPAEALESAGLGERIRVVNPSSGREFTAEVIAHGKVLVHY